MRKVLSVFGTRPEAIKMAPLVRALAAEPELESRVCVTAQHREMLDQVLECFSIRPDYDLDLMKPGQTLTGITSAVLEGLGGVLDEFQPDAVLVHGDTTTTFAAALAAFYRKIPVGHVEAGLRTGNKYAPWPEEMNRCLTGQLAEWHFAPTAGARENLLACGVKDEKIVVTGNTVIDALFLAAESPVQPEIPELDELDADSRVILMTCHRRENWGAPMAEIFAAVRELLIERPELELVFPVHPNPLVREAASVLAPLPNAHLAEPFEYLPMVRAMQRSALVLTDSGGLQEEAPALGKPVLVLREVTERPEGIAAGTAMLAGVTKESVKANLSRLLDDEALYKKMAQAVNPYGDGKASSRIVAALKAALLI